MCTARCKKDTGLPPRALMEYTYPSGCTRCTDNVSPQACAPTRGRVAALARARCRCLRYTRLHMQKSAARRTHV